MKKIIPIFLTILLFSCNSKPSLQKFMSENTDNKEFIALDFSADFLNIPANKLTLEEKKALESFKKINVLAFKKNETNDATYQKEKSKLFEVMKDTTKYQEIIKMGNNKQSAALYALGNEDIYNEFVIIGNKNDTGFGIVRILGDNMKPESAMVILGLMEKANINQEQLKPLQELLKIN